MTPAEFDTLRRMLGLSLPEVGMICRSPDGRATSERTINRWIDGARPVPSDAIEAMLAFEDRMCMAVEQMVATLTHRFDTTTIPLRRYRTQDELDESVDGDDWPLGAHAILIGQIAAALEDEGMETEIIWADMAD